MSIDPPAVTVTDITEPTAVSAGIELIDQDAVQLQSLPLQARRVMVRLDAATVVLTSTNRRMRTHTRIREGLLAYVTFGPEASGTVNGLPVRPGFMLAARRDRQHRCAAAQADRLRARIDPPGAREHGLARQGGEGRGQGARPPSTLSSRMKKLGLKPHRPAGAPSA